MDNEFFDNLLHKVDIVALVGRYVPLRRQGTNWWGCCPFHHEKTPSLSVSSSKNMFYCFGCHEGGNAITFVKKIENIETIEAIRILCGQVGIEMPQTNFIQGKNDKGRYERKNKLQVILKDAALFYHHNLKTLKGQAALRYIEQRGLSPNIIIKFGLGVSIDNNGVIQHLQDKGHTLDDIVAAGIASATYRDNEQELHQSSEQTINPPLPIDNINPPKTDTNVQNNTQNTPQNDGQTNDGLISTNNVNNQLNNSVNLLDNSNDQLTDNQHFNTQFVNGRRTNSSTYYDVFNGRVIVPIIDHLDNVVGFGGRDITGKSKAKYRNSNQNEVFDKSTILFALQLVKKFKRSGGKVEYIILVEGYMDAIALHQAGFEIVVASMGTALTPRQARLIKQYVDKVYISYDGDSAGQNATLRSLDILANEKLSVNVINLPNGLDPDDFVKQFGSNAYKELVTNASSLIEHKINNIIKNPSKNPNGQINFEDTEQKIQFAEEALKILSSLSDIGKAEYLPLISKLSGVDMETLKTQSQFYETNQQFDADKWDIGRPKIQHLESSTSFIFASIWENKEWVDNTIDIKQWLSVDEQALYQSILNDTEEEVLQNNKNNPMIGAIFAYEFKKGDDEKKYFECLKKLKLDFLTQKQQEAINANDIVQVAQINKDIKQLTALKNTNDIKDNLKPNI